MISNNLRNRVIFHLGIAISACCLSLNCHADEQHQNLNFIHITPEDGLSHFNVTTVTQDSKGYIWIGTNYGLDKYDGFEIKAYNNNSTDSSSLSSSRISSLLEDSRGNLWIGTKDGGLNLYNRLGDNFISFRKSDEDDHSIGGNNILSIYEDIDSNLWIGTWQGGLNRYNYLTGKFSRFQPDNWKISVTSIFELNNRSLLIGTRNRGLLLFDKQSESFMPFLRRFNRINGDTWNIYDIE